jgi:DMSO/TMAO reductase YedYZ molybdopterin-dependent catalytic subunit
MKTAHTDPTRGAGDPGAPAVVSRRTWFKTAAGGLTFAAAYRAASGTSPLRAGPVDGVELIVRSTRPLDLETPVTALGARLTPNELFFVRSHFGEPAVGLSPWGVEVGGLVDRPRTLGLDDLKGFEPVTVPAVLQCSGNGRAFHRPRLPGLAWERGAVGHAEWTGVRLADVLERAGLKGEAAHVHFRGADGPPSPKTPAFYRSIPLARALDPSTILATRMNGEPLPTLHGGPVRLVVPGWSGNHWMKWVRWVTVDSAEAPGFFMQTGYRMPRKPAPPDAVLTPADLVPLTFLNVKSLITAPGEGTKVGRGRVEVRGVAWTGEGHVTRVDVSTDRDPTWRPATLLDDPRPGSWRRWSIALELTAPGATVLRSRATDSEGDTQPETTPWNKSGYLWNGIDRVTVNAERG